MTLSNTLEFNGFHGTDIANEESILQQSFKKSSNRIDWYGEGAYFFTEGISTDTPLESATQWSIDNAWDNQKLAYKYTEYVIFNCDIDEDDKYVLDLRDHKGLVLFNKFRQNVIEIIRKKNKVVRHGDYMDKDVFDLMKQFIDIKVIIGNVFIKFADLRRVKTLRSNVPNVTMFCVNNTDTDYIVTKKINVVKKGEISL